MRPRALLALPLLIAAVVPRADAARVATRPAVAVAPHAPLYLGVPEANFVAAWGPELSGKGNGYVRCPSVHWMTMWGVTYDARGRSTAISSWAGCHPYTRTGWRALAKPFMPPDARFDMAFDHPHGAAPPDFRYISAWLGTRLGTGGGFMLTGQDGDAANPGPWFQLEAEPPTNS